MAMPEKEAPEGGADPSADALQVLMALSQRLTTDDRPAILRATVESAARLFAAEVVYLWLAAPPGERLVPQAVYGVDPAVAAQVDFAWGEGLVGRCAAERRPTWSDDLQRDPAVVNPQLVAASRTRAALNLPLADGDGPVLGVLGVSRHTPRPFRPADRELLGAFAGLAGAAIRRAQLNAAVEAERREVARLKDFNERILQGVGEAVTLLDRTGAILFANEATGQLIGLAPERLVGEPWTNWTTERGRRQVEEQRSILARGQAARFESRVRHRDGHEIPVLVSAQPLYEGARITGILLVATDLTRVHESEMRSLAAARLEASLQTAAGVAHQLSQPLGAALMFAEWLAEAPALDGQCRADAGRLIEELLRAREVLQRLRAITRFETQPYPDGGAILDLDKATGPAPRVDNESPSV